MTALSLSPIPVLHRLRLLLQQLALCAPARPHLCTSVPAMTALSLSPTPVLQRLRLLLQQPALCTPARTVPCQCLPCVPVGFEVLSGLPPAQPRASPPPPAPPAARALRARPHLCTSVPAMTALSLSPTPVLHRLRLLLQQLALCTPARTLSCQCLLWWPVGFEKLLGLPPARPHASPPPPAPPAACALHAPPASFPVSACSDAL